MKKISSFLVLAILFLSSYVSSAMATIYDCETRQSLHWDHGSLKDFDHLKHARFNFDGETGDLWIANNESSPLIPDHLKVVEKMSNHNDLLAESQDNSSEHIHSETTLQIRAWEKDSQGSIIFLFEDRSLELENAGYILSGICKERSVAK